jgi:hypothetical protein
LVNTVILRKVSQSQQAKISTNHRFTTDLDKMWIIQQLWTSKAKSKRNNNSNNNRSNKASDISSEQEQVEPNSGKTNSSNDQNENDEVIEALI